MKPIFNYIDYRKYLKDFYDESKATRSYFSYRFFSLRAGFGSPVLLKLVIDGKRNISRKGIEKFIKGLNLKEKEAIYFSNLVRFNQAKTALEKQEHYLVLRSMAQMVSQYIIEDEHFDYFDKWYYSVIREGICHYDYQDDWELVAARVKPRITAKEVSEAVGWLVEHGLLRKLENGRYEQTQRMISTRSEVKSMAVRNFNRKMIQLAEQSLDKIAVEKRYTTGLTIGINREAYDVIVTEIEAFRDRIVKIVDSLDYGDRVYQVNFQMFPLMYSPDTKEPK